MRSGVARDSGADDEMTTTSTDASSRSGYLDPVLAATLHCRIMETRVVERGVKDVDGSEKSVANAQYSRRDIRSRGRNVTAVVDAAH